MLECSRWAFAALRSQPCVVADRWPTPPACRGSVVAAPYVDNGNAIGTSRRSAELYLAQLKSELEAVGFALHDEVAACDEYALVGVVLDGKRRTLLHSKRRTWRLWYAIDGLVRRRHAAPSQLRRVAGHLVNHLCLQRCSLSVLKEIYVFVGDGTGESRELPGALLEELKVAQGLLPVLGAHLGRPVLPVVYCSDASDRGFAVHVSEAARDEVLEAACWRERWRFVDAPREAKPVVDNQDAGFEAGFEDEDTPFNRWVDEELRAQEQLDTVEVRGPPVRVRADLPPRAQIERVGLVPPLATTMCDPGRWRLVVLGRWSRPRAIHCKEGRASLVGLLREARFPRSYGGRLPSLGDNLAEVLSFDRGRARDPELLGLCRRAAAVQLATGIGWCRRYIETGRNPSDTDSRRTEELGLRPGQRVLGRLSTLTGLRAAVGDHWRREGPIAGVDPVAEPASGGSDASAGTLSDLGADAPKAKSSASRCGRRDRPRARGGRARHSGGVESCRDPALLGPDAPGRLRGGR